MGMKMSYKTDPVEYFVSKLVFAFILAIVIFFIFKPILISLSGFLSNTAGYDPITAAFVSIVFPIATTMIVIYKFLSIFIYE